MADTRRSCVPVNERCNARAAVEDAPMADAPVLRPVNKRRNARATTGDDPVADAPVLRLDGVSKSFGGLEVIPGSVVRRGARPAHRADRPQRRGQVHRLQPDQRRVSGHGRADPCQRGGHHRRTVPPADAPRGVAELPEHPARLAPHGSGERPDRADAPASSSWPRSCIPCAPPGGPAGRGRRRTRWNGPDWRSLPAAR